MLRRTTDRSGYCNEMRGQYQRRRHTGRHQGGGYHEKIRKFEPNPKFQSWSGVAAKTDATLSKFSITLDPPSSVTVVGGLPENSSIVCIDFDLIRRCINLECTTILVDCLKVGH
jgi:hypothetical protein